MKWLQIHLSSLNYLFQGLHQSSYRSTGILFHVTEMIPKHFAEFFLSNHFFFIHVRVIIVILATFYDGYYFEHNGSVWWQYELLRMVKSLSIETSSKTCDKMLECVIVTISFFNHSNEFHYNFYFSWNKQFQTVKMPSHCAWRNMKLFTRVSLKYWIQIKSTVLMAMKIHCFTLQWKLCFQICVWHW